MAKNGQRDTNTGTLGLGERYTTVKGDVFQENQNKRILGTMPNNASFDPNQLHRSNSQDQWKKREFNSKKEATLPTSFSIKMDQNRDFTRKDMGLPTKKDGNRMLEDTSVSRRSDWKKIIGPIKKRPTNAGEFNSLQQQPNGNRLIPEEKKGEQMATAAEDDAQYDIPNPNNLPILEIKILVAGIDNCGQNKLIDLYGAVESQEQNEEFLVKEMAVEDQYYLLLIEFWIPKDKSLDNFRTKYEKCLKDGKFDGMIMVCSHRDHDGLFLKQGVDYLGELYQMQIMKQLPSLPKIMAVNNHIQIEQDQDASAAYYYQFQDTRLKQAKHFAKKSLNCQAFRINRYQKEAKIQSKIDEAIGTLIEVIIKKKEDQFPNALKAKMAKEPNFITSKIETYRSWSGFEKLQFYFKLLATFLSILSLAQAFISVDSAARIKTYQETWMCNANNISGFFCFFGSIIGFYGAKFENKEYLKTNQMTSAMDLLFNLESLIIFATLKEDPHSFYKGRYSSLAYKHLYFLIINCLKIALGILCLFLAQLLKRQIIKQKELLNDQSAELYLREKKGGPGADQDSSIKGALVTLGFENRSIYMKRNKQKKQGILLRADSDDEESSNFQDNDTSQPEEEEEEVEGAQKGIEEEEASDNGDSEDDSEEILAEDQ